MQPCLNQRKIEQGVLFAARDKGKADQVREHGSCAILPVEPQQHVLLWEMACCEIVLNDLERPSQFLAVATVAPVAKTPEPLEGVSLTDDRASAHHLPALAPGVASSTHLIQPT